MLSAHLASTDEIDGLADLEASMRRTFGLKSQSGSHPHAHARQARRARIEQARQQPSKAQIALTEASARIALLKGKLEQAERRLAALESPDIHGYSILDVCYATLPHENAVSRVAIHPISMVSRCNIANLAPAGIVSGAAPGERVSAKQAVLGYLLANIGKCVSAPDVTAASGCVDCTRRIRELRAAGWQIVGGLTKPTETEMTMMKDMGVTLSGRTSYCLLSDRPVQAGKEP